MQVFKRTEKKEKCKFFYPVKIKLYSESKKDGEKH